MFSAGSDLSGYGTDKKAIEKVNFYRTFSETKQHAIIRATMALKNSVKPIVGLVRGWAVGNGFALGSLFTFLYCTPEARFALPAARAFSIPEGSSTIMLP